MAAHFIIVNGSLHFSYRYYLNWFWESFIGSTREVNIDIFSGNRYYFPHWRYYFNRQSRSNKTRSTSNSVLIRFILQHNQEKFKSFSAHQLFDTKELILGSRWQVSSQKTIMGAHVNFILTRRDNLHLQAFTEICSLQNSF